MASTGETSKPKFATATSTADGDYGAALVAAVTGKKLRVIGMVVTVLTTAGVFSLKTNATVIFQAHCALGTPLVVDLPGVGICETVSGDPLIANNGVGVDSFVNIAYQEIEP